MKRIQAAPVDDVAILEELAGRVTLSSHPLLEQYQAEIAQAYIAYAIAGGRPPPQHPWLPKGLQESMRRHYENQVQSLEFIEDVRTRLSAGVCPMCGSQSASTADHVLPKASWPVYSFFSKNLVPACDQCNRRKADKFFGDVAGAGPIHPYFDDFLLNRVAFAKLTPPYSSPLVEIVAIDGLVPEVAAVVNWHLAEVVCRTSVCETLLERWTNICRSPRRFYEVLEFGASMGHAVQKKLDSYDLSHGTPNNWESMLQFGILSNPGAIAYLQKCEEGPAPNLM